MAASTSPHATDVAGHDALASFLPLRPRLIGLAYRMLGLRGDAEDVVQEAYLRWHEAARGAIRTPEAWLVTAVTRLAMDRLRARRTAAAAYVGPWLPEPWLAADGEGLDRRITGAADLSLAFMVLLERLTPEERATFLLHDVFEVAFADIAATLGKTEAACRQLCRRARLRLKDEGSPRSVVSEDARRRLVQQYLAASRAGDQETLLALFAPDATFTSDGGGEARAAMNVIRGAMRCARMVLGIARKSAAARYELVTVNGEVGFATFLDGRLARVTAFDTDGHRVLGLYTVLNPTKLERAAADLRRDGGRLTPRT